MAKIRIIFLEVIEAIILSQPIMVEGVMEEEVVDLGEEDGVEDVVVEDVLETEVVDLAPERGVLEKDGMGQAMATMVQSVRRGKGAHLMTTHITIHAVVTIVLDVIVAEEVAEGKGVIIKIRNEAKDDGNDTFTPHKYNKFFLHNNNQSRSLQQR